MRSRNQDNKEKVVSGTVKDKTVGMKYSENMLGEVLVGAGILAAGYAAFKSGYARKNVSSFLKKSSRTNTSGIGNVRAFRAWVNNVDAPANSLVRNKPKIIPKGSYNKLKTAGGRKELYSDIKDNIKQALGKEALNTTADDIGGFVDVLNVKLSKLDGAKDTDIYRQMEEIKQACKELKKRGTPDDKIKVIKAKMIEDLVKKNVVNESKKNQQLLQTGHRSITIGDLFDIEVDDKGVKQLKVKGNSEVSKKSTTLTNELKKKIESRGFTSVRKMMNNDNFKNLRIDPAIMTDGKDLVDLRYVRNILFDLSESAAKDFKIPIIGINPFSLLGVHEIGRPKPTFATIKKGSIQSSLTGHTRGIKEEMFYSNGAVYKILENSELKTVKKHVSVEKISHVKPDIVSREVDAIRKMNGINRIEYERYERDDGFLSNLFSNVAEKLDIGFDDIDAGTVDELGANNVLNPNYWINKGVSKFKKTGFLRPNKGAKVVEEVDGIKRYEKNFIEMFTDGDADLDQDLFVVINDAIKMKDIVSNTISYSGSNTERFLNGYNELKDYTKQFIAGRNNLSNVTKTTAKSHFFVDRVSSTLGIGGLGFSSDSLGSPLDVFKNLMLKRALPIYVGYNAMQFGIMLTEHDEDELGNKDNVVKHIARMTAKTDLVFRKGLDILGVSDVASGLSEAMPGFDNISEIPGINMLNLDMNYDERLDWYQNGYDVIRKNRYWDGGNQALTGCLTPESKIITQDGLVMAKDIKKDYHFAISKDANWHKIIASKTRSAKETVYNVKTYFNRCDDVWLTGNHNVLVVNTDYFKKNKLINYDLSWKEISKISKDNYLTFPVIRGNDNRTEIRLSKTSSSVHKSIHINKNLGMYFGHYAASGCIDGDIVKFIFCSKEVKQAKDTIDIVNKVFGVTASLEQVKNNLTVSIKSSSIANFTSSAVQGEYNSKERKLSKWLKNLVNEEMWIGFIKAFMLFESYKSKNAKKVNQPSLQIILDIQSIMLRFGVLSSIKKDGEIYKICVNGIDYKLLKSIIESNKKILNKYPTQKLTHNRVGHFISRDLVAIKIKKIVTKDFDGDVYDFEVECEESFSGAYVMHNSKIEGYRPNLYRRIMTDAEFSDSKWGSRFEYFSNAPFPTPLTPFAPIKHFITDPYHYDKKHMEDRPYAVTSPMFQNIPFVGGILSSTIGEIIKPTKYTHPHIFNDKGFEKAFDGAHVSGNALMFSSSGDGVAFDGDSISGDGFSGVPYVNISSGGRVDLIGGYSSDSGFMREQAGPNGDGLKKHTVAKVREAYINGFGYDNDVTATQNEILYNGAQLYEDASNFFGLYGFMGSTVTGSPLDSMSVVENSSYSYSASRLWWNESFGGIGGDTNEIARRFLRKRMSDDNLINPISNNMPEWMPGRDNHIDFKHGDPMVKISNGELRLPGQAYERLHDIKEFDLYKIDASSLISEDVAINDTLAKTSSGVGIFKNDSEAKKEVLGRLSQRGILIDSGGAINDYDRNLSTKYDGIAQMGNTTGLLFVEEMLDSSSKKRAIIKANVAMYETGEKNAFLQFINEDGTVTDLQKINYDENIVNEAMDNMVKARENIKSKIDTGVLSNADMYSNLDKLRILGDVAPYSDEYSTMASIVANDDSLTESEQQEVQEIKRRVTEVKKPLRVYDYKFKNRSTEKNKKIIDMMLSRDTFTVVGDSTVYRLAGININSQEDEQLKVEQQKILDDFLGVGKTVTLEYDSNPAGKRDSVIVYGATGIGMSLQDKLLQNGFANENDSDDVIDVAVKTNPIQKIIGKAWESFAHLDTPFHSKFLRVRSPKEDYERTRVYGKSFSSWSSPISDYLIPLVFDRNVGRSTFGGMFMGVTVGAMFGKTKFGTIVGGGVGLVSVAGGKVFTKVWEEAKGETWRPKRVREEQELYDYMDKIKFVKYRKLYHEYADKAEKEGLNVRGMVGGSFKLKGKTRVKKNWFDDYTMRAEKAHNVLGIPRFMTRLLMPRSGQKVTEFISNDLTSSLFSFTKKIKGTVDAINADMKSKKDANKYDKSKAVESTSIGDKLNSLWSIDVLKKEADIKHKKYLNSKMSKIRNTRILTPLRYNFKFDKEAPPSLELEKLMEAKANILNAKNGASDGILSSQLKKAGIIPVYKGRFSGRHIDINKTLLRVNEFIDKATKKAGFSKNAAKALEYYKMSEATMYAYDKGDNISDVASAMEKRDRDYFREFVKASDSEKLEILDLVPKYMRRPLEASWGLEVEKKDDLFEYFTRHAMPDKDWSGWSEGVDIANVKVKMAKNEQLEFSDTNIWANDVQAANMAGEIAIPKLHNTESKVKVKHKMDTLMGKIGYADISYHSREGSNESVNLYLKEDKKAEYLREIEGKFGRNL